MSAINWLRVDQNFSWDQANAIAKSGGGRLLVDDIARPNFNWTSYLADALGDFDTYYESSTWFGITAVSGGYKWVNGQPVNSYKFAQGDPNADANPLNNAQHPVYRGSSWRSDHNDDGTTVGVQQAFIEYTSTKSIVGTKYNDRIYGGGEPGETIKTGDGNDAVYSGGGGTIDLGNGNDVAVIARDGFRLENPNLGGPTASGGKVYDGAGRDNIEANGQVIYAAIDGDNDIFYGASRVTYSAAKGALKADISGNDVLVTDEKGGVDTINETAELVGGSGNDHLVGIARLQGGAGNDYLAPGAAGEFLGVAYAEGGTGNDTLVTSSLARADLRGEAGNDTLILRNEAKVSGGVGADTFVFEKVVPVTIQDLTSEDRIDLSALTDRSVSDLFANGYLKVERDGGYTRLSFDADGGGNNYQSFAYIKGVFSQNALDDLIVT